MELQTLIAFTMLEKAVTGESIDITCGDSLYALYQKAFAGKQRHSNAFNCGG